VIVAAPVVFAQNTTAPPTTSSGACPIDLFMGNWSGTCSQTTFPKTRCTSAEECSNISPLSSWGLAQGYDGSTSNPPCTQSYNFSFYKVGQAIMYEYQVGDLIAGTVCKNAVSNESLFAYFQKANPDQWSFSVNDTGVPQSFYGSSPPCLLGAGATRPNASTSPASMGD
jgi:hypothetical protein